ncbi:MAG: lysophospholipid acyltransferase family protein, partial [Geminicoccaceae bacterium]
GLVVVSNHPMLLDGVLLASRLPRASCIMSSKLMGNVFIGVGARFARYIQVEQPLSMIKEAVQDLKRDAQLIIFPEGTRTAGERVNRFRPGVTLIAKKADVPIQTVFIETRSPFLTKGWPILKPPPLPIEISVRLGRRFQPEADHAKLLADLEEYFVTSMRAEPATEARVAPSALHPKEEWEGP